MALQHFITKYLVPGFTPSFRPARNCTKSSCSDTSSSGSGTSSDGSSVSSDSDSLSCASTTSDKGGPELIELEETAIDKNRRRLAAARLCVCDPPNTSLISGIRQDLFQDRLVRIYQPSKSSTQSGKYHIGHWELDWDNQQRWENPNMGWCSNADPLSGAVLKFATKQDAIQYAEKSGWRWYVQQSAFVKKFKPKSYAINFVYDKRTRVSTK